ncbi:MAG: hypothetical protein H7X93_09660, partial [Sphingomonadaceae bacterium]|nr:hypothetical protein [Sphingomonadaceae bacterium]
CAARPDDLIGFAFRFDQSRSGRPDSLFLPLGGDVATHHLGNDAYGLELVAGRRESFDALGAFEPYAAGGGIVHEYISRAILAGRDYLIAPEPLVSFPGDHAAIVEHGETYEYLKDMALLEGMPLAARKIWLFRGGGRMLDAPGSELVRDSHRPEGWTVWLTDPARIGDPTAELPRRGQVLLGFDRDEARLRVALWHRGRLLVGADEEMLLDAPEFGEPEALADFAIEIMPLLEENDRARVRIAFDRGKGGWSTAVVFRRVEREAYLITSSEPVYWDGDFDHAFAALGGGRAATGMRPRAPRRAAAPPGTSLAARLRVRVRGERGGPAIKD